MRRATAVLLVIPLFPLCLSGCSAQDLQEQLSEMRTQAAIEAENKAVVQRYWDGKWNERRPETLDELQTPDVVYHGTSWSMEGIEEYRQVYNAFRSAFHDSQLEVEEMVAEGDRVMTRVTLRAVHEGEFAGIPPTGSEITIHAFTVFRLVDGKIAEEWEIVDELGLMEQLGMELGPGEPEVD